MNLTRLFACHFRDGRAASAALLRDVPATSMGDTCAVQAPSLGEPQMPHFLWSKEELDTRFPGVKVLEAVDAHDPQALEEDAVLKEEIRVLGELVKAIQDQGRRKRLAEADP